MNRCFNRCDPRMPLLLLSAALALLLTIAPGVAHALSEGRPVSAAAAEPADQLPKEVEGVGVDEHLGAQVPRDVSFTKTDGKTVTLGEIFDGRRPVVLTLNYSNCPMLCSLQLNGLFAGLQGMPWDLGKQYQMVTISIDPLETTQRAAQTKERYLKIYGRPGGGAGWSVLTGREENIRKVAAAVGFNYRYNPVNKQYAHAAATMICTPDGRLSRYLFGVQYDPQTLRFSLLEAADGKVGSPVEQALLYCFQYDAAAGRYAPSALKLMKIGSVVCVAGLAVFLAVLWLRDFRRARLPSGGSVA